MRCRSRAAPSCRHLPPRFWAAPLPERAFLYSLLTVSYNYLAVKLQLSALRSKCIKKQNLAANNRIINAHAIQMPKAPQRWVSVWGFAHVENHLPDAQKQISGRKNALQRSAVFNSSLNFSLQRSRVLNSDRKFAFRCSGGQNSERKFAFGAPK